MKWLESRILWGSLLILGGVLFLLQNLGLIEFGGVFWALLFGIGALFFLSVFFSNRLNWWALIPGMVLLSIGVLIALGYLAPQFAEIWGGSIVLTGIGLSFLLIYLMNRSFWWAIIPSGVLLSLAVILGLDNYLADIETGGLFLIGLGVTFGLLAIAPNPQGRMWWAWIPAGILVLIGLFLTTISGNFISYVWPLALIIGGGIILYITLRSRSK